MTLWCEQGVLQTKRDAYLQLKMCPLVLHILKSRRFCQKYCDIFVRCLVSDRLRSARSSLQRAGAVFAQHGCCAVIMTAPSRYVTFFRVNVCVSNGKHICHEILRDLPCVLLCFWFRSTACFWRTQKVTAFSAYIRMYLVSGFEHKAQFDCDILSRRRAHMVFGILFDDEQARPGDIGTMLRNWYGLKANWNQTQSITYKYIGRNIQMFKTSIFRIEKMPRDLALGHAASFPDLCGP